MISEDTFAFLKELAKNNRKDWFEEHKSEYVKAKENLQDVMEEIAGKVKEFDDMVRMDDVKYFRIYRDVRFGKDKTPYKTNLGATISPAKKMENTGGYYVHVEPGGCFVAGGMHMPDKDVLGRIRDAIVKDDSGLREIIEEKAFKKFFGELRQEGALKTAPKGYPKDHPAIDLLRLKGFIAWRDMSDEEMMSEKMVDVVVENFKLMWPLVRWLRGVG